MIKVAKSCFLWSVVILSFLLINAEKTEAALVGTYNENWQATKYRVARMRATLNDNPSISYTSPDWVCLGPAEWKVTGSYSDGTVYEEWWRAKNTYGNTSYTGEGWVNSYNVQAVFGYVRPIIISVDYSFANSCPNPSGARFSMNIPGYGSFNRLFLPTGLYGGLIVPDEHLNQRSNKYGFYIYTMGVRSMPTIWSVDGSMTKP